VFRDIERAYLSRLIEVTGKTENTLLRSVREEVYQKTGNRLHKQSEPKRILQRLKELED
jgi:hypothetical protein